MATKSAPVYVPVTLPRAPKNEEQFLFVGVNDQTYQIPRGKTTMVPLEVDNAIRLSNALAEARDRMVDNLEN